MKYINEKDIKPGDIILTHDGKFISHVNDNLRIGCWITIHDNRFNNYAHDCTIRNPTKASYSQIQHLKACIKANKYVSPPKEINYEIY